MGSAYSNIVQTSPDLPLSELVLSVTPVSTSVAEEPISQNILAWGAYGAATGYQVFRQINNGGYVLLASPGSNAYIDEAVALSFAPGQYQYYVVALDDATVLATSNVASVTWPHGDENPLQLAITQSTSLEQSTVYATNALTWNDVGAYTYTIFRAINGKGFDSITQVGDASFSYADEGIKDSPSFPAGNYAYYVLAADYQGIPIASSPIQTVSWS